MHVIQYYQQMVCIPRYILRVCAPCTTTPPPKCHNKNNIDACRTLR